MIGMGCNDDLNDLCVYAKVQGWFTNNSMQSMFHEVYRDPDKVVVFLACKSSFKIWQIML
jgi:hypothetical protein